MRTLRLRQAVVAAWDRDAVVAGWARELGLGAPFHDPAVAHFGLCNAVVPVGDTFLEVVTPLTADTAAGRHLSRHGGDCGYMAIFQVADMDEARSHLGRLGLRTVFEIDHEDIRCTHVHPADLGAAIVSFDEATPASSWRWAGPAWPREVRTEVVTGLAGVHLATPDPAATVERWAAALAVAPAGDTLTLDDGSYVTVGDGARPGLTGIDLWAADGVAEREFDLAGVRYRVTCSRVRR